MVGVPTEVEGGGQDERERESMQKQLTDADIAWNVQSLVIWLG